MPHKEIDQHDVEIKYIDTDGKLNELCKILSTKVEFAFDTEFDRFYREYGFKLSLLQIFDGEKCYLIDPIAIKDLQSLWVLFDDPAICKVVYSCSEDIQILKVNGCFPKNIYDIQIAAKLCNYPATSLAGLMLAEFGVESDKTLQRSNWRRRPLTKDQVLYAGNDVSRLLKLKKTLEALSEKRGVSRMISEENKSCEKIAVSEYVVKISVHQKRKYDAPHQKILLDLMLLRNEIAIEYNTPPANIVSDATLEQIIENKDAFLKAPFSKGFSKRLSEDALNQNRIINLVKNIRGNFIPRVLPEKRALSPFYKPKEEIADTEFERKYDLLYNEIIASYGKESGEYILRGFKKVVNSTFPGAKKMKEYQQDIIEKACKKLRIDFGE